MVVTDSGSHHNINILFINNINQMKINSKRKYWVSFIENSMPINVKLSIGEVLNYKDSVAPEFILAIKSKIDEVLDLQRGQFYYMKFDMRDNNLGYGYITRVE